MKQWVAVLARLVVGGVWLYAGLAKLTDPLGSVTAVQAYELLPRALEEPVGYALPAVEVVIGLALVLGLMTRGAAVISAVLFVGFIIGIASVWARGMEIDCGCFGGGGYDPDASSKYPYEIARDVALLAASGFLVWAGSRRWSLDSLLFRTTTRDDREHDLEGV
ncbi:MauE/DoxX family redox-associated membrane protein [Nocardioides sp. 1609]|uniref:DoxX family protein n=1 Tax=Nocardioides sp. 1609 TaxID=2508327 RepID=UPI00106F279D|nr:MauE/DoxX family redox-associated membrane protein [Nocardioides sp. 1609]